MLPLWRHQHALVIPHASRWPLIYQHPGLSVLRLVQYCFRTAPRVSNIAFSCPMISMKRPPSGPVASRPGWHMYGGDTAEYSFPRTAARIAVLASPCQTRPSQMLRESCFNALVFPFGATAGRTDCCVFSRAASWHRFDMKTASVRLVHSRCPAPIVTKH